MFPLSLLMLFPESRVNSSVSSKDLYLGGCGKNADSVWFADFCLCADDGGRLMSH